MTSGIYTHKKGFKHSDETRNKIRNSLKGFKHHEEVKIKIGLGNKGKNLGKHCSEEHKKNIRKANLGKHHSDETKLKMSLVKKGKKLSQETKRKLSESLKGKNKGKICSDDHKRKIGLANKGSIGFWNGKKLSQETCQKIKIARYKQIFPLKDSSIEVKVRGFLDELKVEYFQHKYMNIAHGYQCDFFIPSINTVIECDGNYWHKYPTGREIDHIRTKELIENGFKVLRLWEVEIKEMGLDKFKERLYEVNVK
ncbi:MAG: NUMOD3 domain-containing DNA-binding protein [archaeon]|nr:NUMOD3 domain-containing DNA-binding protein [archaeon]